jgi:hypothetical protein
VLPDAVAEALRKHRAKQEENQAEIGNHPLRARLAAALFVSFTEKTLMRFSSMRTYRSFEKLINA